MDYKTRAQNWFERALKEKDNFVKFILFYISFEVIVKLNHNKIRSIKNVEKIKNYFLENFDGRKIEFLKNKLDNNPLKNMKPSGDLRWKGKLDSKEDFDGIIEFIIRARNNLFHGDKKLDDERDEFIVSQGNLILEMLLEGMIKELE